VKKILIFTLFVALSLVAATSAMADTIIWLSQESVKPGTGLSIYTPTYGSLTAEAGNYILNVNPTAPESGTLISGYCVEPVYSSHAFQQYTEVPITAALTTW